MESNLYIQLSARNCLLQTNIGILLRGLKWKIKIKSSNILVLDIITKG